MENILPESYVLGKSGYTFYKFPKLNENIILKGRFQQVEDGFILQQYQIVDLKKNEILIEGDGKIVPFDFENQKRGCLAKTTKELIHNLGKKSKL